MPVAELTLHELQAWGRRVGAALPAAAVVTLSGDLGAGKTTLAQALCAGLGVRDDVTSPTYAIAQQYATASGTVWHFDLYRLRDAAQLRQVAWDDAMASGDIVLVEWPELAAADLPVQHLALRLAHVPGRPELRRLTYPEALA